jgi:shikimate kinase
MKFKKIFITGFMGTGKTTVGKLLASKLKWLFFDTDALAENAEGITIAEIFEKKGEEYFRKLEKRCFEGLSSLNEVVIATGGGTLLDPENLALAQKEGAVICLWASEEDLRKRLSKDKTRPLLKSGFSSLMELLKKREPSYKKISFHVDTSGIMPDDVCNKILEIVGYNLP